VNLTRPPSSGRFASRALIPRDEQVTPDPPADPRGDIVPNANAPIGTVGADVPAGVGDSNVMYPGYVSATPWAGWPVGWDTPFMEPTPSHSTFFGYGQTDPAGYLTRVSTVGTCVDINSRALVAMAAYAVKAGVPIDLPDWYQTSPEPLEYADWCEFIGLVVDDLMYRGEAILWATAHYADGFPQRFVALDPGRVTIDERGRYAVTADDGTIAVELDRADVCHIRYKHDRTSGRGYGPLAWAGRDVVAADVLDRYADNLARHGTSAVLTAPGDLTAQQADNIRRDWARLRAQNPGTPAVLSGGITYASQSMTPRDMALLDLKIFDLQMISTAFGVPAGMAGLPQAAGGLTYSSPVMLRDTHWTGFLLPLCQRIAGPLSNWLLPRGTRFEFNPDRYLQASAGERAQMWATLAAIGDADGRTAITIPEIRTAERLAPWDALVDQSPTTPPPVDAVVGSARG
jgi:HK97 family phage portal protein